MTRRPYHPYQDPFKTGFCDGIMGREADSPWKGLDWKAMHKDLKYIEGWALGRKEFERNKREGNNYVGDNDKK